MLFITPCPCGVPHNSLSGILTTARAKALRSHKGLRNEKTVSCQQDMSTLDLGGWPLHPGLRHPPPGLLRERPRGGRYPQENLQTPSAPANADDSSGYTVRGRRGRGGPPGPILDQCSHAP